MGYVHTPHGPGQITGKRTVRGRTEWEVTGSYFRVWLDGTKLSAMPNMGGDDQTYPEHDQAPQHQRSEQEFNWDKEHNLAGDPYKDARRYYAELGEDVMENNSVRLPYNPDPQYDATMADYDSTIQPGQHIDADDRLHPADSLDFDDVSNSEAGPWPGPDPDLFAKDAYRHLGVGPAPEANGSTGPMDLSSEMGPIGSGGFNATDNGMMDAISSGGGGMEGWAGAGQHEGRRYATDYQGEDYSPDIEHAEVYDGPGALAPGHSDLWKGHGAPDGVHQGRVANAEEQEGDVSDADEWLKHHPDPGPTDDPAEQADRKREQNFDNTEAERLDRAAMFDRPAGLSDRYASYHPPADHFNDPVQQFRDDPMGFLRRRAFAYQEAGLDHETGEWMRLVEADVDTREAAWKDVRTKALRLREAGAVSVKDLDNDRIYASVNGDHGTYDVMIVKGSDFNPSWNGGGSQGISNWSCSCDWGKWAFKRQQTYVGRLCSHGYAAYLEMQSRHQTKHDPVKKGNPYRSAGRMDVVRSILDSHQAQEIDGTLVDVQTANLLGQIYDKGSDQTKQAIETAPLDKVVDTAWKLTAAANGGKFFDYGHGDDLSSTGQETLFNHYEPQSAGSSSHSDPEPGLFGEPTPVGSGHPFGEGDAWGSYEQGYGGTGARPGETPGNPFAALGWDDRNNGDSMGASMEDRFEYPDSGVLSHDPGDDRGLHGVGGSGGSDYDERTKASDEYANRTDDGKDDYTATNRYANPKNLGDYLHPRGDKHDELDEKVQRGDYWKNPQDYGRDDDEDDHPDIKHFGYHEADILQLHPQSLTPDANEIMHDGLHPHEEWDVTKDERKTTGPDQIMARIRMASDEALLDKLRNLVDTPQHEDFGNMDQRNQEIRDVVDELHDRGYAASPMVAMLHQAEDFGGDDDRRDLQEGFAGSGPAPKYWMSDSESYVDEHERPHFTDVTDLDGDVNTYVKGRDKVSNLLASYDFLERTADGGLPGANIDPSKPVPTSVPPGETNPGPPTADPTKPVTVGPGGGASPGLPMNGAPSSPASAPLGGSPPGSNLGGGTPAPTTGWAAPGSGGGSPTATMPPAGNQNGNAWGGATSGPGQPVAPAPAGPSTSAGSSSATGGENDAPKGAGGGTPDMSGLMNGLGMGMGIAGDIGGLASGFMNMIPGLGGGGGGLGGAGLGGIADSLGGLPGDLSGAMGDLDKLNLTSSYEWLERTATELDSEGNTVSTDGTPFFQQYVPSVTGKPDAVAPPGAAQVSGPQVQAGPAGPPPSGPGAFAGDYGGAAVGDSGAGHADGGMHRGTGGGAPAAPAPAGPATATPAAPAAPTEGGGGGTAAPAAPSAPVSQQSGTTGGGAAAPGGGGGPSGAIDTSSPYTVQSGDTLSGISDRAGLGAGNYQGLADSNNISNPNLIMPGQTINFGAGAGADTGGSTWADAFGPGTGTGGADIAGGGGSNPMGATPTPGGDGGANALPSTGGTDMGAPAPAGADMHTSGYITNDDSDVVRQFQAGFTEWEVQSSVTGVDNFDIASAAQDHLAKVAGRNYTFSEQAELMNERHPLGARNLDDLDLAGTHYLDD